MTYYANAALVEELRRRLDDALASGDSSVEEVRAFVLSIPITVIPDGVDFRGGGRERPDGGVVPEAGAKTGTDHKNPAPLEVHDDEVERCRDELAEAKDFAERVRVLDLPRLIASAPLPVSVTKAKNVSELETRMVGVERRLTALERETSMGPAKDPEKAVLTFTLKELEVSRREIERNALESAAKQIETTYPADDGFSKTIRQIAHMFVREHRVGT